jgi:hypothetical protein
MHTLQSVEKSLDFMQQRFNASPSLKVTLNPFRTPLRLPKVNGGSVGFPT